MIPYLKIIHNAIFHHFRELFPSNITVVIFITYMILFINQGLLITSTKSTTNKYSYDPTIIVLLTEYLKLFASIAIYLKNQSIHRFISECVLHKKVLVKYMIPAFLYCLYNNLQFINLSNYDPTTYFILLQFRVVVTGLIYQILFSKKLTKKQWVSLIILTLGCVIKQAKFNTEAIHTETLNPNKEHATIYIISSLLNLLTSINLNWHLVFIFIQILCSCFAGVYNEFLLKNKSGKTFLPPDKSSHKHTPLIDDPHKTKILMISDNENSLNLQNGETLSPGLVTEMTKLSDKNSTEEVPIMIQNVYMYLDSVICNYLYSIFSAIYTGTTSGIMTTHHPSNLINVIASDMTLIFIIINGAGIGLITSFFLKYLDSILKNFASALEIIFTALLAKLILGIPAGGLKTAIATALVFYSVWLYSANPVTK